MNAITLDLIEAGSFFRCAIGLLCRTCTCRGDEICCLRVSQGEFGPVVQHKIEIWLSASTEVTLTEVSS